MPIAPKISHKIEDDVLHVTVEGWVKVSEMAAYASDHIVVWASSPRLIWDLRTTIFFVSVENKGRPTQGDSELLRVCIKAFTNHDV